MWNAVKAKYKKTFKKENLYEPALMMHYKNGDLEKEDSYMTDVMRDTLKRHIRIGKEFFDNSRFYRHQHLERSFQRFHFLLKNIEYQPWYIDLIERKRPYCTVLICDNDIAISSESRFEWLNEEQQKCIIFIAGFLEYHYARLHNKTIFGNSYDYYDN